jgi:phosphohistidine phosphatase SixA
LRADPDQRSLLEMNIYLLRHAEAEPGFPDDSRILHASGREHARRLGDFLRAKPAFQPTALWCSPFRRAQQTAELLLEAWGGSIDSRQNEARLEPERNPAPLIEDLQQLGQDVLVVGHNPNISILASLLLSGERARTRVHFNTAVMVCLQWDPVPNYGQFGPCELDWMLDPRMI